MIDYLSELSHRGESNKWSNIGLRGEIRQVELMEVHFTHFIW